MNEKKIDNIKISKITLGTVQLGVEYGISNKKGKPTESESLSILDYAKEHEVNTFDTAPSYGNSEEILGKFLKNNNNSLFNIITKIPKIPNPVEPQKFLTNSVENSLKNLNVKNIPICLFHSPTDMKNEAAISHLTELKDKKMINMLGISVYEPSEVIEFLDINEFDVIQVPLNVFDTRLIHQGLLKELNKKNKIVFARSIFLQGLLLMDMEEIPESLDFSKKYIKKFEQICTKYNINRKEMAISFVKYMNEVSSIILGSEKIEQVEQNLEYFKSKPLLPEIYDEILFSFEKVEQELINPSLWV